MPNYAPVYGEVVRRAKPLGVRFTYGSDAHDYRNLGMSKDVDAWINECGLVSSDFWCPADLRAKRR